MGINKTSMNMVIKVKNEYNLYVGNKLQKVTSKMNVESTHNNFTIHSNKRIISLSNEK
jgi:hypothetical protein